MVVPPTNVVPAYVCMKSSAVADLQASLAAFKQQLAALDAVISAHKLGLEQHQATASTTEKALHQHAAAEGAAQAKWADAEQAAAQLQQAIEARKGQLCSKEEALQAAQAQLHAFQVGVNQACTDPGVSPVSSRLYDILSATSAAALRHS